jgi:hypothetical protein
MMLSMRRSHQTLTCIFIAIADLRQKRGNGILSCSGLLNGVFGTGEARHVACWETGKVVDRFEETDDQEVTTIRESERFTQRLTLVFADGRTAVLSEEDPDAKCTPEDGAA